MSLFQQMGEMGHERVLVCSNPDAGLKAIIAVHSTLLGPGLGGCRMWPYANEGEAITDVLRLSRGMTYKAAAAGINLGGAKAVILGDSKAQKNEVLLRAFGRAVDSLGGLYITAEDVGTDTADMEYVAAETRWVTGLPVDRGGGGDPSPVTAWGVHQGIKASAHWVWGSDRLAGKSVAIQGLGSVGSYLASYLAAEGVKVFGCDIDSEACAAAAQEHGVEIVPSGEIFDVDCDIFAPCALGAILNDDTVGRLKSRIVAGGANNQLADPEVHGLALDRRGILYAPDFVINAGGLVNVYNEYIGYQRERAMRMAGGIFRNTLRVFEIARRDGIPTYLAGDRLAEERLAAVRELGPRQWERQARRAVEPAAS
jgi:leucine dehydrogenase